MEYNVLDALAMITREKNISRNVVIESLVAGLQSAARKKVGAEANIDARVDEVSGEMTVEQVKVVAAEVEDEDLEISLEDARRQFGASVQPGDEVRWELPLDQFGRNAILVAKQILVQKVREAERMRVFETFKDRLNDIIIGNIQQIDRGNVLVSYERVEALLPYREQIRGETLQQGHPVTAFIIEVLDNAKGPQIILSRTHPGFLKRLFEKEVPEIQDGIVEIKAVAREPGTRSKIAVVSHDERVDAVGSCVGMKGSRVQAVTRELFGERIDIVPWSAEPSLLISRALSPAEVSTIILDEDAREATVVVNEDQLSKAIGKEGKNVRLAAKLTEWKIDLVSSREYHIRQRVRQEVSLDLEEMSGVSEKVANALREAGFETIQSLAEADPEALLDVKGVGPKTVDSLLATAQATLDELERIIDSTVVEELAQAAAESQPLFDEDAFDKTAEAAPGGEDEAPAREEDVKLPKEDLFTDFEARVIESDEESAEESAAAADESDDDAGSADEESAGGEVADDADSAAAAEAEPTDPAAEDVRE